MAVDELHGTPAAPRPPIKGGHSWTISSHHSLPLSSLSILDHLPSPIKLAVAGISSESAATVARRGRRLRPPQHLLRPPSAPPSSSRSIARLAKSCRSPGTPPTTLAVTVGRPRTLPERPWPHHPNSPDREPTWAYLWDNVSEMTSDPKIMYRQYTAELDTLTAEQVEWEPYGTYYRIGMGMPDLNHKCTEEARFWHMRCPLICMWLVEHHQPHRVMRQFGLYQECPPQWQDTDKALHRLDRQRQRKIKNWPVHHSGHVAAFLHCLGATRTAGPVEIVPHDLAAFNNYLQWFHENTRIELVKHAYAEYILDDPIEFDERSEIQKTADECEVMWDQSGRDEKPIGPLRHFIKIPDDEKILSQSIPPSKPHGKKVVIGEDEGPPRRSSLSRMRNDEPFSSEEEEQEEQEEQQQQEPRQRTKRMAIRKQPARTAC
ncbi:hypothetical protein QYE76_015434 [Lolium multiflorum]|uniref:Aminotransferase-like plant mobile domain-containing protein n=1 Tax=Lolium multiflorum TaxID=4521 RepID=A0AAD8U4U7_LOLMU|nr:hypothetical protein QYE76_015434 [Lolium multiflorum]